LPDPKVGSEATDSRSAPQSQQKRILLIAGLVVAVALIIAASIYLINLNKSPGQQPAPSGPSGVQPGEESGEVLPQSRRTLPFDGSEEEIWFGRDPFATPLKLTGIVTGGFGDAMAIIESGSAAYIVTVGDVVEEIWTVTQISRDAVDLITADREIKLQLTNRAIPEVVTKDDAADDDGEEDS
jgi:hypothetical protein